MIWSRENVWLRTFILAGTACSPCAGADPKAAVPQGNASSYFSEYDYPVEAVRLNQEGRVSVKLAIDAAGKVTSCVVEQSSNSPSIDARTCEIASSRLAFAAARDQRGRPVGSFYMLSVRWALPTGPIDVDVSPPPKFSAETTVAIDAAGVVTSCATVAPLPPATSDLCDRFTVGFQTQYKLVRGSRRVGSVLKFHVTQEIVADP